MPISFDWEILGKVPKQSVKFTQLYLSPIPISSVEQGGKLKKTFLGSARSAARAFLVRAHASMCILCAARLLLLVGLTVLPTYCLLGNIFRFPWYFKKDCTATRYISPQEPKTDTKSPPKHFFRGKTPLWYF